jgi:DNA-binding GntR family transcriptional regulator
MAKRTGSETLAVNVYEQLRYDILNRGFTPGERLKPVELGRRFGVSLGVMREALSLLAAQNLVVSTATEVVRSPRYPWSHWPT